MLRPGWRNNVLQNLKVPEFNLHPKSLTNVASVALDLGKTHCVQCFQPSALTPPVLSTLASLFGLE